MAQVQQVTKEIFAKKLFDHGLIKFGSFTLKSGITSPFYIDLRQAQSFPDMLNIVAKTFAEMLDNANPDAFLAGVPEAGTPLATATGFLTKRRLLQPRKQIKSHGTKRSIEGAFKPGDKVIMIDDLITKGDSKLEAIEQVTDAGLELEKFIVLIDREQGGLEAVRNAEHAIEAAVTITEVLDILMQKKSITKSQYDTVVDFITDKQ